MSFCEMRVSSNVMRPDETKENKNKLVTMEYVWNKFITGKFQMMACKQSLEKN